MKLYKSTIMIISKLNKSIFFNWLSFEQAIATNILIATIRKAPLEVQKSRTYAHGIIITAMQILPAFDDDSLSNAIIKTHPNAYRLEVALEAQYISPGVSTPICVKNPAVLII